MKKEITPIWLNELTDHRAILMMELLMKLTLKEQGLEAEEIRVYKTENGAKRRVK